MKLNSSTLSLVLFGVLSGCGVNANSQTMNLQSQNHKVLLLTSVEGNRLQVKYFLSDFSLDAFTSEHPSRPVVSNPLTRKSDLTVEVAHINFRTQRRMAEEVNVTTYCPGMEPSTLMSQAGDGLDWGPLGSGEAASLFSFVIPTKTIQNGVRVECKSELAFRSVGSSGEDGQWQIDPLRAAENVPESHNFRLILH